MTARLVDFVEVHGDLVPIAHLPREAADEALDLLVVHTLLASHPACLAVVDLRPGRHNERASDGRVHAPVAPRGKEPELVPLDRPADPEVEVPDLVDLVHAPKATAAQLVREIVGLPRAVAPRAEERSAKGIPAILGDDVHADPARRDVGAGPGGLVRHLLHERVVDVLLHRAVAVQAVDHHPVHLDDVVGRGQAPRRHVGLLHRARAAHVGLAQVHAGHELAHREDAAACRQRVERLSIERLHARGTRHVDDRRRAGHGDRLLEGANLELGVERRREVGRQLEAVAPVSAEAGQRKGHRVGARTKVGNAIAAVAVGDRRLHTFDQYRTGRFHRHAGHRGTGDIPHDTGNRALGVCRRRRQEQESHDGR